MRWFTRGDTSVALPTPDARKQSLARNDEVVQLLTAARIALEIGDVERTRDLIDQTLDIARRTLTDEVRVEPPTSTAHQPPG